MMKRRAIVTMIYGDVYEEISKITLPKIKEYARHCKADVIETLPWEGLKDNRSKTKLPEILKHYQRAMFVDIDCIIQGYTADIFEVLPQTMIGARRYPNSQKHLEMMDYFNVFCIPGRPFYIEQPGTPDIYNCGLYLLDRSHYKLYEKYVNKKVHDYIRVDDEIITSWLIQTQQATVWELPRIFHFMYSNPFESLLSLFDKNSMSDRVKEAMADTVWNPEQILKYNEGAHTNDIIHTILGPKNPSIVPVIDRLSKGLNTSMEIRDFCIESKRRYLND